jgi:hypothetical protein
MRPGRPGAPHDPQGAKNPAPRQKIGGGTDESSLCFQYLRMSVKVGAKMPIERA